jgi:hypothetical protein
MRSTFQVDGDDGATLDAIAARMAGVIGLDPSLTHTAGWHATTSPHGAAIERGSFAIKTRPDQFAHSIARPCHIRDAFAAQLAIDESSWLLWSRRRNLAAHGRA